MSELGDAQKFLTIEQATERIRRLGPAFANTTARQVRRWADYQSCLLSSVSAVAESSPNRNSSQHSSSRSSRLPGLLGDDVGDHMTRSPESDFVSFLYRAR